MPHSSEASLSSYHLVWSDEFNGQNGNTIDPSKWNTMVSENNSNNELEYYTNHAPNASLDGRGHLIIRAIKEDLGSRNYTSARLNTAGKFEQTYGKFEARIKLPFGNGIWPAFWLLGNNIKQVGWPTCGEIDIMENIGKEPNINHGSMHGPGYNGSHSMTDKYSLSSGSKLSDNYHLYAIEWEPNVVRFYLDDILYSAKTPANMPPGGKWIFDHPMYLILNVAVGGNWPGSPNNSTQFPAEMIVDYVRVYQY